jgi:hypothetical protein
MCNGGIFTRGLLLKVVRDNNIACHRGWDLCAKVGLCPGLLVKVLRDKNYGLRFFESLKKNLSNVNCESTR